MANKLKLVLLSLFCAIFIMSYNVSAIDFTFGVRLSSIIYDVYFQDGNSTTWRHSDSFYMYGNNANNSSNGRLFTISNNNHSISVARNNYISVTGSFVAYSNIQDQFNASGTFGLSSENTDCEVLDFDVNNIEAQNNSGTQQLTYKADWTLTCRLKSDVTVGPTLPLTVNTVSNPGVSQVGILFTNFAVWSADYSNSQIYTVLNNIYTYLQNQESSADVLNQEKQDVADASQDGASAGTSSEQSVEGSTQSLMSAGTTIIGALTSATATDCNINVSTSGNSSAFTSAIGNLNLCSDVPSGVLTLVQGMVALVFTPIVLYYVYNILTLIYAQFKEYNS